jgi:hypothetical protein
VGDVGGAERYGKKMLNFPKQDASLVGHAAASKRLAFFIKFATRIYKSVYEEK